MHIWPSLRIRDSFKFSYLSKIEWNLNRMKRDKQSEADQKLLRNRLLVDDRVDVTEMPKSNASIILSFCGELLFIFSCCFCCFFCGVCSDQEDC